MPVHYDIATSRIVLADPNMIRIYDLLRKLARSDLPVVVSGETGCGKENAAAALHAWSARFAAPFIAFNCAALPESLVESELFGVERGAYTDARATRPGLLERAHGGTLFLDEVGDLALATQAKLLRALEVKRITRLGDVREREIDVRLVAATNVDLSAAVAAHRFRSDLLYRLAGATVTIPPLRDRTADIPELAALFVGAECQRRDRPVLRLAPETIAALCKYHFPGNVRELKNMLEFALAIADDTEVITPEHLPPVVHSAGQLATRRSTPGVDGFRPLSEEVRELERRRMIEALEAHGGVQTRAAAALLMPLRTFTLRMREFAISRHAFRT